jgi:hypothetical protein
MRSPKEDTMGYEDATATKIMATHCACCGRPLLDAKSVETGMGPVCRKKYGYGVEVSEDARIRANKVIYDLALAVSQNEVTLETMALCSELRELGFPLIADIFLFNAAPIAVETGEFGGEPAYFVRTPYHDGYRYDAWTKTRAKTKKTVVSTSKKKVFHWVHPQDQFNRERIWNALVKHFAGQVALINGEPRVIAPLKTAAQKAAEASQKAA